MSTIESKKTTADLDKPFVERRRASLPQPDFTPYKKANAYPGPGYFFVGHSYNLDGEASDTGRRETRIEAIKSFFSPDSQWVPVGAALTDAKFFGTLSRFEQDLLSRLPESALIGPAIDRLGVCITHSFTIWRREMRKQQS